MSVGLRRLLRSDGAQVLAWRNSPEVARWMYSDHLITPEEHGRWLDAALTLNDRRFWIIEFDGTPVGLVNLARIDRQADRCEWAFYLADPAVRGRGVGTAVEYAVAAYVFEELKLRKLCCEVLADDLAVIRLHENFGFVQGAVFRQHVVKAGRPCDVVGLSPLDHEWPNVKRRMSLRAAQDCIC